MPFSAATVMMCKPGARPDAGIYRLLSSIKVAVDFENVYPAIWAFAIPQQSNRQK